MATLAVSMYLAANPMSYLAMGLMYAGASYIDAKLFPGPNVDSGKLSDLNIQVSTYGNPISRAYGTIQTAGNIVWGTNFVEHKKKSGGKGGGGGTVTSYTYSVSFAVMICKGPISGIGRIWADGKLFADLTGQTFADGTITGEYEGNGGGTFTVYQGTETQLPDAFMEGIEGAGNVPAYRPYAYVVFKDLYVTDFGQRIPTFTFEIISPVSAVDAIVREICTEAGLAESDFDVTDLSGSAITGYLTDGGKTHRAKIEPLQSVIVFDGVERNGKLTFLRRKNNLLSVMVYALDESELSAYENDKGEQEAFAATRTPEQELPARVVYAYLSKDREYQTNAMGANRLNTTSKNSKKVDLPVVLTDSEGKTLAETALYAAWNARTSYELKLATKYACLFPGDLVKLPIPNASEIFLYANKNSYGKPGITTITAETVDVETYDRKIRTADASHVQTFPDPPTAITAHFLDLFYKYGDTDETPLYVTTTAARFIDANIFRSHDDGLTWEYVATSNANAEAGAAATVLAAGPVDFFDEANTVDVVLLQGTLSSRSEADILNGYNAALIGDEILQFKTATLIAANTYRLSGLLRGRNGTESLVGSHAIGDRFILLSSENLVKLPTSTADWFHPVQYRIGPSVCAITSDYYSTVSYTSDGTVAKPFAPCHLTGSRDGSGNLTINWIRRSRKDFSWQPYVDAALSEGSERYEIDVYNGAAVVRTISATASTAVYTAAQQTADFGSAQASVNVKIYQLSDIRGRGWPAEGAI